MFYETVFAMLNGYWIFQVGMDKHAGPDTRLTYLTTGVLLQKLITGKNMHQYTHVILDEVVTIVAESILEGFNSVILLLWDSVLWDLK